MILLQNQAERVKQILRDKDAYQQQSKDWLLPLFMSWYIGYDVAFHNYYIYNGQRRVYLDKKHLNMAKKICEDWASLLMSEKVQIKVGDSEDFQKLLKQVKLTIKLQQGIEVGFALGYSAIVAEISNLTYQLDTMKVVRNEKTKPRLALFKANQIVPVRWENDEVVDCAFVSENDQEISINIHLLDQETDTYHIVLYRMNKVDGTENMTDFNTGTNIPFFQFIHPNIVNNLYVGTTSKFHISIYANSIDILKTLDEKFNTSNTEFVNGKKRMFVSSAFTTKIMVKGSDNQLHSEVINPFDDNDVSIYTIPPDQEGKTLIYTPSDELRVDAINAGIQMDLNLLSNNVGLGTNYYKFEKGAIATATQVISEKDDAYKNKCKHQQVLEPAIVGICKALIYINNTFTTNPTISEEEDINVLFDDSIIEDKKAEQEHDRADLEKGIMSLVEYRIKWYAEDEATAREKVYAINGRIDLLARARNYSTAFMGAELPPKAFVNLVFTDDDLKVMDVTRDEMIAHYINMSGSSNEITEEDLDATGGYVPPTDEEEDNNPTPNEEEDDNPKPNEEEE